MNSLTNPSAKVQHFLLSPNYFDNFLHKFLIELYLIRVKYLKIYRFYAFIVVFYCFIVTGEDVGDFFLFIFFVYYYF